MPLNRRQRRLALASALVALLTFAWVFTRPPGDSQKSYAFLEQHPWLSQVARVGFVIVGKQDEFDVQLTLASIDDLIIDGFVELGPDIRLLNSEELQPPPPPVASEL